MGEREEEDELPVITTMQGDAKKREAGLVCSSCKWGKVAYNCEEDTRDPLLFSTGDCKRIRSDRERVCV